MRDFFLAGLALELHANEEALQRCEETPPEFLGNAPKHPRKLTISSEFSLLLRYLRLSGEFPGSGFLRAQLAAARYNLREFDAAQARVTAAAAAHIKRENIHHSSR